MLDYDESIVHRAESGFLAPWPHLHGQCGLDGARDLLIAFLPVYGETIGWAGE